MYHFCFSPYISVRTSWRFHEEIGYPTNNNSFTKLWNSEARLPCCHVAPKGWDTNKPPKNHWTLQRCYRVFLICFFWSVFVDLFFFVFFLGVFSSICWAVAFIMLLSLKLTDRTWKWMVGRRSFPFGMAYFQVRTVSFRECTLVVFEQHPKKNKHTFFLCLP